MDLIAGETFVKTTGPYGLYLGQCTSNRCVGGGDIYLAYRGLVFKTFKKKITGTMPYDGEPEPEPQHLDVKV